MSGMAMTIAVIFGLWVWFPAEFGKAAGKTVKAYRAEISPTHEQA